MPTWPNICSTVTCRRTCKRKHWDVPNAWGQELLALGEVELVGAPSTSWKTKAGMVNWRLGIPSFCGPHVSGPAHFLQSF